MAIPKRSRQDINTFWSLWEKTQADLENKFPYPRHQLTWEDVYGMWKRGGFPYEGLDKPVQVENIFVDCENKAYSMYGYDWLSLDNLEYRREYAKEDPVCFLWLKSSNKGTILTAELLATAESDEERAAIWIAATAKELYEKQLGHNLWRYADDIYLAANKYLKEHCNIAWHHAMKGLVPDILIPYDILQHLVCESYEMVMSVIKTNVFMLKNAYRITVYSSEKDGSDPRKKPRT